MTKTKKKTSYALPIALILGVVIGSIIGIVFKERAVVLKPLGDIFINLMFTIVVPLVFLTISAAVSNMIDMARLGKIIGHMFLFFFITGLIAAIIMISVVNVFPPAQGVNIEMDEVEEMDSISWREQVVAAITVEDFPDLISRNHILPLIIFAIFFGICTSLLGEVARPLVDLLSILSQVFMKMISLIMYYAPIGLGAYFANLVGTFGSEILESYLRALIIYIPMCIIYFFVAFTIYSYYAGGIDGIKAYFSNIFPVAITSLATQSSIASIPVSLEATENIGVPKDIADIVIPIGATAHMDGTVFSSILKISFLFGVFDMPFTGTTNYITAVIISVLGGVVMSGVPGGGLIGEMLIVNLYGFPMEAFPIVATIGYIVDAPATMINVTGDTVVSMMVTRAMEGRDWLKKKAENRGNYEI